MNNNSRFFLVLLSLGAAIGVGNVWLYAHFSFKSTGLFFIPYLIALVVLGAPLVMLELSIGQYFNKNVVDLFAMIRKGFSSIGWLMLFNSFIVMSFYAVVLSWHIVYFFASLGLQWKDDAKAYFFGNVIQVSDGFKNFTQFSLPVFIALVIAWVAVFFYLRKGFESMKKGFLVTVPLFLVLMLFFLMYSLSLDNALSGVYSFLKLSFKSLLSLKVWLDSFALAILSLGLSFGIMHAFARKSGKGFMVGVSCIVVLFELMVSIAAGFILFGMLGFLEMKQGAALDISAFLDLSSQFTILAQALPFFHKPTFISLLFFAFLSIFFVLGTASLAYSITHILVHKFKTKHMNAAVFVAGFGFLLGLLFIIKPGFYIMDIMSHFVYYNVLIAILLEALAMGWFFDSDKIASFINQNSVLKIGKVWRFVVRYFVPLIVLVLLFSQAKSDYLLSYKSYPLIYLLIFGVGTIAVPLIAAFLMPQRLLDRK
ncbi:hypothetical protein HYY70_06820 [Candidatus Woesearchaeota archaeon]|nr:hypothetical protein [Candidatus Woesearchaeota archaeon]